MALVKGTNFGFVLAAPVNDPAATASSTENNIRANKDTSPSGASKITEIGWWCDNATEEANFEVGIYTHSVGDDEPLNLLAGASQTNAKGTTAGWKKVTGLNISISPSTIYWIAVQLDDTATTTNNDRTPGQVSPTSFKVGETTLANPWPSSSSGSNYPIGIYAVVEIAGETHNLSETDTTTLSDSVSINAVAGPETHPISESDITTLSDTVSINAVAGPETHNISESDTTTLSDSVSISLPGKASGLANKNTMWVNNSGTWVEFNHYEFFEVKKKQNQMSEFEVKIFDITTPQKAYFKEQAEVLFFAGTTMILKGRIQTIEYGSTFEVIAKGFGMEAKLLDKQFIKAGDNRVQYTNESAETIAEEINDSILTTASDGIWPLGGDFGSVSLRFEYANRLNALGKLSETIDYYWWVSQTSSDNYSANYIHLDDDQGLTASQKTYNLTSSAIETSQEKDITNLVNYVYALGYGDGINQLSTSMYAASTQSSFLDLNITSTDTSILCADGSVFDATGSARIAKEIVTYAGISSNTLTGCSRGVGTTAKAHNRNCYIEQSYTTTSAQTGSSIKTYGLMDYTLIDKTIIDTETLEVIASGYLSDRKTPILRIKIIPDEPLADASLNIGDNVTVTDSESDIDSDYRIVGQTYRSDYGFLSLTTEVSNRSLEFIEQMNKSKQDTENQAKYMQGATNIISLQETENLDNAHPLNMTFYIPDEAVKINMVKLNFNQKGWRSYGDYQIQEEDLNDPKTIVSIGAIDSETYKNLSSSGTPTSATTSTLTDTNSSWDTNSYQNFVMRCDDQLRVIESNSGTVAYLTTPWADIPTTNSFYQIIEPYTTSQTDVDLTNEIDSIGVGEWANIKFENAGGLESYDKPDSSLDTDLWSTTNAGTGGRVTASTLQETATFIEGDLMISAATDSATYNIGCSTSSLPELTDMAEISFRIQRGAQIPTDDSDGALSFTTGAKSYGNLSEGIDYNVSGDTLYLFADREYNFSSMNIGAGTTVVLDSSETEGSVLDIFCTGSATLAGTININGANNPWTYGDQVKTTYKGIVGPGVANGGSGGSGGGQGNGFGGGGSGGWAQAYYSTNNYNGSRGSGGVGGQNPVGGSGNYSYGAFGINGNVGVESGGGSGGIASVGPSQVAYWASSGDGASSFGGTGGDGSRGYGGSDHALGGSGGGGGGGRAGKQGCHFYLHADEIIFSGTINTSGFSGTNGGNGGKGYGHYDGSSRGFLARGGCGGGGGGGGNAGNIKLYYITSYDGTGKTTIMTAGSNGGGGTIGTSEYYNISGGDSTNGSAGTAGSAGSFTSQVQVSGGFPDTSPKMYVFGETYDETDGIGDDDSKWSIKKQANDDWILYNDEVSTSTISPGDNVIGVSIDGTLTTSAAVNYNWKLYDLQLGGRARMRIEANAYMQTFIKST